ncbi:hypothetical protein [Brevundimonas aurantiaca]|uniref:hypothetical protein n=1 Tax=Brevundimonas aurantiaca TaxID=74316 RepID=UPI00174CD066|nr:hypothetical protein [Brevundimonas aurantiaca]
MQPIFRTVAVLDLLLDRENPRHVAKDNQEDVIAYLLADEEVYNLARHMSSHGINPLEVVAVYPDAAGNLIVAEGNRRMCAAQLLTDPDKAPDGARGRFRALAAKSVDVSEVTVIEFPDYATAKPWLQVLHDGEQDGVGRRRWKPEQKARATSNKSTDALAVAILDYAEREGIISDDIRQGVQVSTATRYLANPSVRRAMGLASPATSTKILISGGTDRFAKVLTNFFDGIRSKKLHSRSVTADWNGYADELNASFGIPPEDIQPSDVTQPAARPSSTPLRSSSRPTRARIVTPETRFIAKSATVIAALNKLDSYKLSNLYNSLTSLRLDENPVLLTAGAWVFVETLTALHGKTPSTDFVSYLNGRFASLGVGKDQAKDCKLCLEYISQNGNAGKHSGRYAAVDARNLNNHFHVLEPVFVALLDQCPNEQ